MLMGFEDKYDRWKRTRAEVEVPDDFAERVMASIHQVPRRQSRIVQAAAAALAVAVCVLRIGGILAIFIPS
jgi:hypothetical protein